MLKDEFFFSKDAAEELWKWWAGREIWNVRCNWDYLRIWNYASFKILKILKIWLKLTSEAEFAKKLISCFFLANKVPCYHC